MAGFKNTVFADLLMSKAEGTLNNYLYKCRTFFAWLSGINIHVVLPICEEVIAAYIADVSSSMKSDSAIITTAAALKWLHSLVNSKPNPVDSPLVQQILIAQKRKLHKPPHQKEPISLDIVKMIVEKYGNLDSSLMQLRTACYVSLKFTLLFRHDEMAQLRASHIKQMPNGKDLEIYIPRSKTDVFREGSKTYISDTNDESSPVKLLHRYMSKCNLLIGQDDFLFTALSYQSSIKSYKPVPHRPLSYTRCRELFLEALKQVGIHNPKNYGLHSMRSGGASHLANKGVSEELLMEHGRWKTHNAKNRYVKRDVTSRLETSKVLQC